MQWKSHSCILIMITNLTKSAKHGSKDLHLPKSHCQLNTESLEVNGCNRHPIRFWEIFHRLISFAYVQQVSLLLKGTTQKSVWWYKFYIGNCKENLQENELKCDPYIGWSKSSIGNTWMPIDLRLLLDHRMFDWCDPCKIGVQLCTRRGF